jgi:flagellar motor switch protein FliG
MNMAELQSFDDFTNATDREIQAVIQQADQKDLVVSLWSTSPEVKEKFLQNMAGELLTFIKEELDFMDTIVPRYLPETERVKLTLRSMDDLIELTDKEIQAGLRTIDQKELVIAMTQASEEAKEKLMGNFSQRVRTFITEELEVTEPLASEEVERVQKKILARMETEANKVVEQTRAGILTVRENMMQSYRSQQ